MNKPLVSVVIPTYSRPIYLKRCIDSVLNQTYANIEIIVVDDNNPDTVYRKETEEVMAAFDSNPRISYLKHEKNKNGSAARNTGWRKSSGEYITFVDDDDVIEKTKIEKQVSCLEELDETWGMCYCGYRIIKDNDYQISSETRFGDCYLYALMRTMFMGSGSNLFLRKSVVDEIHGYDESFKRNQDIEFLVRATEKYKLAYINEVLLTIFQQGPRGKKTFEELESYTIHYLNTFNERINKLSKHDKKRVISVISLERFRIACYYKRFSSGVRILFDNKVSFFVCVKYFFYLIHRKLSRKSYGFSG